MWPKVTKVKLELLWHFDPIIMRAIISKRAKRASSVIVHVNRDFRYVRIYMWPYVKPSAHAQ